MENINILQLLPVVCIVLLTILVLSAMSRIRLVVRRRINRLKYYLSGGAMATALLKTAAVQTDAAATETPLTLSNLESIYVPKIKAAYPDLNPEDLRNRAGIILKEYLDSVKGRAPTLGLEQNAAKSLCDSVRHLSGIKYENSPYTLHQALISGFGDSKIQFNIAYKSDRQRKATVEFAYMKEAEMVNEDLEKKCTNCGAVLTQGAQVAGHCLYCDQVFKVVNEYAWLAVKIAIQ